MTTLVTFHSKAWSSITLFDDVAIALLKLAGHSGTVPSAWLAADTPVALARLQKSLAAVCPEAENLQVVQPDTDEGDAPPPVGLRLRAHPLIELLSAAALRNCDVMWEEGAPLV